MSDDEILDRNLARLLGGTSTAGDPTSLSGIRERAVDRGLLARRRRHVGALAATAVLAAAGGWVLSAARGPSVRMGRSTLAAGEQAWLGPAVRMLARESTRYEASSRLDGVHVEILEGDASFLVDPGRAALAVDTPAGTVRVTGTQFEVRYTPMLKMTRGEAVRIGAVAVAVFAGTVLFTSNGHEPTTVAHGEILVGSEQAGVRRLTLAETASRLDAAAKLESDNGSLRERLARNEEEVAELRNRLSEAEAKAQAAPPVAPVRRGLDAVEWDRGAAAIVASARRTRQGLMRPDPAVIADLMKMVDSLALARDELGGASGFEALYHPAVQGRLAGAVARSLNSELDDTAAAGLGDSVRRLIEERARSRPSATARLVQVAFDLETMRSVHELLVASVGPEKAGDLEGVQLGPTADVQYGSSFRAASDRPAMVEDFASYIQKAARPDAAQKDEIRRIAGEWADASAALRERMVLELGEQVVRAALSKAKEDADSDPLAVTRRAPGFHEQQRKILNRITETQGKYEAAVYAVLDPEARRRYQESVPTVLVYALGE